MQVLAAVVLMNTIYLSKHLITTYVFFIFFVQFSRNAGPMDTEEEDPAEQAIESRQNCTPSQWGYGGSLHPP